MSAVQPNKALQPTATPPLRCGSASAGFGRTRKGFIAAIALIAAIAGATASETPPGPADDVLLHPPFSAPFFTCGEHSASLNFALGDALGTDCVIQDFDLENELLWARPHISDGAKNEDWYGWRADVLAPCTCEVVMIHINETTNTPGKMIPGRATSIIFRRSDGTHVLYAHLRELEVKVGETVEAGAVIGRVGNNGYSRHPHVHIGAWSGDAPLQVRFDQYRMAPQ